MIGLYTLSEGRYNNAAAVGHWQPCDAASAATSATISVSSCLLCVCFYEVVGIREAHPLSIAVPLAMSNDGNVKQHEDGIHKLKKPVTPS
jgi:hypothetical protein